MTSTTTQTKPFAIGQEVYIKHPVTAAGHFAGMRGVVSSVTNNGTKKCPKWRVYLGGIGYYDADCLSLTHPIIDR